MKALAAFAAAAIVVAALWVLYNAVALLSFFHGMGHMIGGW